MTESDSERSQSASSPLGAVVGINGTASRLIQERVSAINSKPAANSGYNWTIRSMRDSYWVQEFILRRKHIGFQQARAPPDRR